MAYELTQNQQLSLLTEQNISQSHGIKIKKITISVGSQPAKKVNRIQIQNRRFLGNKFKLLDFIEHIVYQKCDSLNSFCDIFAGTGVVGHRFSKNKIKVISNDLLFSNYVSIKAFLGCKKLNLDKAEEKIAFLNQLKPNEENYFSEHYGGTFFTKENARKIGFIREQIAEISDNVEEYNVLLTSLIYAVDKVANTVGHYDAFRKDLDMDKSLRLYCPDINEKNNANNEVYREDANMLIRKITTDILYIDPPYNSRQYCDTYHLLENLATWKKPPVNGKAKKMDRSSLKSAYCLSRAPLAFGDLIENANCKHIFVSYNNTGESKVSRSNARISDEQIVNILQRRGKVEIFEHDYHAFTAGKSNGDGHAERLFYCKVER